MGSMIVIQTLSHVHGARSGSLFLARPQFLQLFASARDLQALGFDGEPEPLADPIFDLFDLLALELDDLFAVLADNVAVVRMIGVVGIVKFIVFAKIHFAHKPALREQRQCPINCRARYRAITPAGPIQQLLCGEMLFCIENRVDDCLPLRGQPQTLAAQELDKFFFGR